MYPTHKIRQCLSVGDRAMLTDVVESTEERVLIALDLQLLSHSGPVGGVQCILIEPLDVEAQAAEREKDAVELAHQLLLFGRVMARIPL